MPYRWEFSEYSQSFRCLVPKNSKDIPSSGSCFYLVISKQQNFLTGLRTNLCMHWSLLLREVGNSDKGDFLGVYHRYLASSWVSRDEWKIISRQNLHEWLKKSFCITVSNSENSDLVSAHYLWIWYFEFNYLLKCIVTPKSILVAFEVSPMLFQPISLFCWFPY